MFDHWQPGDLVRICWNVATRYPRATYLVVSINGTITVESAQGKGTSFIVTLPKAPDRWVESSTP